MHDMILTLKCFKFPKLDELSLETPASDEDPGDVTLLLEKILTLDKKFKRVNITITDHKFKLAEKKFPNLKYINSRRKRKCIKIMVDLESQENIIEICE